VGEHGRRRAAGEGTCTVRRAPTPADIHREELKLQRKVAICRARSPRHGRLVMGLWRRLAVAWLACTALAAMAAPVRVLEVHDAIGPASADFIVRGIAQAAEAGAPLVVIELDTPGGLDSSMRQIIQAILAARVPVAVYVAPEGARAASAGTYILYAAHIAAMAPATTLGAATPVSLGLPGIEPKPPPPGAAASAAAGQAEASASMPAAGPPDAMKAKQVHDAAAFIRGLAQQRARNAEWAERAVREAVSLTATEALRDKVIDVVADDVHQLLDKIDGRTVKLHGGMVTLATRGAAVQVVQPDWRQRLLSVIANPSFALVLMMIGIYGLIFEFSSPGFGVAGPVGAICLLLAAFALQLLPVNYAGLALIVLGVALLAAELLSPSFGVLGVGGVVAFIAGGLLLFDRDVPGFGVPLALILGLAASSTAVVLLGGGMALRARQRPVVSGREDMIGARGRVLSVQAGQTWAEVNGERWKVHSREALAPGQRVRVLALDGLTLQVQVHEQADDNTTQGA
jgi:membrane-bound serine protease (ClpP class)